MLFKRYKCVFSRILFCTILPLTMQGQTSEELDQFIAKIPYEQKIALEDASQNMFVSVHATLGYVLYGHKPMCIISAYEFSKVPSTTAHCDSNIIEHKWFDFITRLNIQSEDKKYPFIEYNNKLDCIRHLIFINRDSFIETVNKNLSLFRYILGRTLTAESFLDVLLKSGDRFYDILKSSDLLLGILLGYGTQNALIVSREGDLAGGWMGDGAYFPFEDRQECIKFQQVPSIGFANTQEEWEKLHHLTQVSRDIKDFDYCSIPHFGCDPNLKETKSLLSIYEKDRETILEIVKEGDLLQKLLKRLCTTVSGEIKPPRHLDKQIHKIAYEDSSTQKKFIDCVALSLLKQCKDSHFKEKPLIEAVLKGMKCAEEGGSCPMPDWIGNWADGHDAPWAFEHYIDKKKADQLLQKLAKQPDIVALVPKYVYHKVLVKGEGTPATNHIKNATFHFSLYDDGGTFVDSGTIKKVGLEKLVPGIAYSLIGMQRGEEREIYIHPKYAYGSPLFPSMLLTRANLKLLDFEEGETEATLPKIRAEVIDEEHLPEFLKGYKKAKGDSCFYTGYHFWKNVKELGIDLDLEEFSKRFRSKSIHPLFQSDEEERQFILDYNCYLFSREYAKEALTAPFR